MCALTPARVASGRGAAIRYSLGDASAAVELALDENGHVITIATGHGWRWFTSAIWSEIQQSQHTGTWERLRQCRNPVCRSTFYDRSWDDREVWHSARKCGPLNSPKTVQSGLTTQHQPR